MKHKLKNKDFLIKYILEQKKWIILIVILDLIGSLFTFLLPLFAKYIIDSVILNHQYSTFYFLLNIVIIIAILSAIFQYLGSYLKMSLRGKLFFEQSRIYFLKSINDNKKYGVGEITNSLTDVLRFSNILISSTIPSLIKNVLQIILIIITLLIMDFRLTVVSFIPIIIIFLGSYFISRKIRQISKEQLEIFSSIYSVIKTIFGYINFVNVFSLDNFFLGRYENILEGYVKKQNQISHLYARQMVAGMLVFLIPSLILIFYGGHLVISGEISLGLVTMFVSYLVSFSQISTDMMALVTNFQQTIPSIYKLGEIYNAPSKQWGDKQLNVINGDIEIKHIHFEYDRVIFEDFSAKFKKGINILSGSNGSGKSTLLNILTKIIEVPDGKIFFDGLDINEITESSLRRNVGFVMANPFIFDSTLRENICLDNDNVSDNELMDIIKKVKLDNLLDKLPKGFDTMLSGDNINLSSGEQQKISLARVLLRNPKIILIDEVGSNIDKQSLKAIYECLISFKDDKTIIIVDHHLQDINDEWNVVNI